MDKGMISRKNAGQLRNHPLCPESVQKLGRCISSGVPGLRHDCTVCSVRWTAPACRRWPDAFAV